MQKIVCCIVLLAAPTVLLAQEMPGNVIFFISDGCGPASFTMARDFGRSVFGHDTLALDEILTGISRTRSASSRVTDSAAAVTALACGVKTRNGSIGVDTLHQPLASILEAAEREGWQTGLVSTARITHATPAGFSAHVVNRAAEDSIAIQQIHHGIELLMGGGKQFYLPVGAGGMRTDSVDVTKLAVELGYQLVGNRDEMMRVTTLPVLALFSSSHMAYELDRARTSEPSLTEMTKKALELLSRSDSGFFVMIEAGRIDHAAHGDDPAAHVHEVLEYDRAVAAALAFARRDGNTLVIGTSDHEAGGLSLGRDINGRAVYNWQPDSLAGIRSSIESFTMKIRTDLASGLPMDSVLNSIPAALNTLFGLRRLSDDQLRTVRDAVTFLRMDGGNPVHLDPLSRMISDLTSEKAIVGWSTHGHSAVDVPVYAFGPGSESFRGAMDNTDIALKLADLMRLDLSAETARIRSQGIE